MTENKHQFRSQMGWEGFSPGLRREDAPTASSIGEVLSLGRDAKRNWTGMRGHAFCGHKVQHMILINYCGCHSRHAVTIWVTCAVRLMLEHRQHAVFVEQQQISWASPQYLFVLISFVVFTLQRSAQLSIHTVEHYLWNRELFVFIIIIFSFIFIFITNHNNRMEFNLSYCIPLMLYIYNFNFISKLIHILYY